MACVQVSYLSYVGADLILSCQLSAQERRIPTSRITLITDTFDISNTHHAEIPAREGGYLLDLPVFSGSFVEHPACRLLL